MNFFDLKKYKLILLAFLIGMPLWCGAPARAAINPSVHLRLTIYAEAESFGAAIRGLFHGMIARVRAATGFDSSILPSDDTGNINLGSGSARWGYEYFKNDVIINGNLIIKNTTTTGKDVDVNGQLAVSATGTFSGNISVAGTVNQGNATSTLVPTGMIMFYAASSACPGGWSEYTLARGRYIVGLASGGTLATTTGSALGNIENRVVGPHTHTVVSGTHTHTIYGKRVPGGASNEVTYSGSLGPDGNVPLPNAVASAATGITVANSGTNISSASGTNAPYVQLLVCQKS